MPKKVATIDKFKTGAHSIQDPRDLPEGAVADAVNVMTDVEGKVRQMGRDISHPLTNSFDDISNNTPGYGFFTFKSDNRITDNVNQLDGTTNVESTILAYQSSNTIGFFDTGNNDDIISLGGNSSEVKPAFYYSTVDGAIRMCDANYSNLFKTNDLIDFVNSNFLTKYFKCMNKTWFASNVASSDTDTPVPHEGWINNSTEGLDSFIYPPTVEASANLMASADTTSTAYNLVYHHASTIDDAFDNAERDLMTPGNIGLYIDESDAEAGDSDWLADDYNFGISFVYEGGQESQVTSWDSAFHLTLANTGRFIELQIFVCTGKSANAFDPRIIGCNVYLTGDSGGMYDDPYYLAEFHWGTSEVHGPRLTNSDGNFTEAFTWDNTIGVVYNTAVLNIHKTPVITYSMRNGFRTDSESVCLNYTTSVIANRRCYAGNVRRYSLDVNTVASVDINNGQNADWKQPDIKEHSSFVNNDLMIVSPVDKYDIFPDDNTLDLGSNDGDHIILLLEYADRLLQFKQNKTYLINISEDLEFIEAEYDFMGIKEPYQAIKTEEGIAWVNQNGCYLYNGEEVVNLIQDKIGNNDELNYESLDKFPSWSSFVGDTAMIGYIPKNKQLVIFQNPTGTYQFGNVLIYDMKNEGWTRGYDRVTGKPKSNVVTKYDNTLLYSSPVNNTSEDFITVEYKESKSSQDETWTLTNVNSSEISAHTNGSQLLIGSTAIMGISNYPLSADQSVITNTFAEHLKQEILAYMPENTFEVNITATDLVITMKGSNIDLDYTGQALSWSTGSSMGVPVTNTAFTISPLVSNPSSKYITYKNSSSEILSGFNYNLGYDTSWNHDFDHLTEIGYSKGPRQFDGRMLAQLGLYSDLSIAGYDVTANDEPRIKINRVDGSNYTFGDSTTATEIVIDLYSPLLHATKHDLAVIKPGYATTHNILHEGYTVAQDFYIASEAFEGIESMRQEYSNLEKFWIFSASAPKEDGSGEDSNEDNNSVLKEHDASGVGVDYYKSVSTISVPSVIFGENSFYPPDFAKIIIIPGAHGSKFIDGMDYTFANTGDSANNQTYNIGVASEITFDSPEIDDNYKTITILSYLKTQNSSFYDNVKNFATFNDVTITGAGTFTGVGSNSAGAKSVKQELLMIPRRKDQRNTTIYNLSLIGQDNIAYFLNKEGDQNEDYYVQNSFDANLKRKYRDCPTNNTPWWDTHTFMLPGHRRLFTPSGLGVTTTGNLDASNTNPFNVTLGSGVNLSQIIEAVDVGDLLMARNHANGAYEIMNVTAISGVTVTVVRLFEAQSSTGSAVNFGEVDLKWYKTNCIKQVSATQFQIKGGDYRKVFVPDLQFHIYNLGNDSDGDDAWSYENWSSGGYPYERHHTVESSSYAATTGTTVNIKTGLTYADASLQGTDGAYYFKIPANSVFVDNMAGDMPGFESISGPAFITGSAAEEDDYYPQVGFEPGVTNDEFATSSATGYAIDNRNALLTCRAQHIIANTPDYFSDIEHSTWVTSGLEFRQFNNDVIDGASSNAISTDFPSYVLTQDLVLDDDMYTKKALYNVSVSYKYSGSIVVEAIVNGSDYYYLSANSNQVTSQVTVSGPSSMKLKRGRKSIMPQGPVTQSSTQGTSSLPNMHEEFSFSLGDINNPVYIKNARTIQFKVIGLPGGYGFEVNDISVVYRSLDTGR